MRKKEITIKQPRLDQLLRYFAELLNGFGFIPILLKSDDLTVSRLRLDRSSQNVSNLIQARLFYVPIFIVITSFFLIFTSAPPAMAHGLGTSKQVESGEYLLEFEYEALEKIPALESIYYSVRLLNKANGADVEYDSVFVKIASEENSVAFSGVLAQAPDTIGLSRFLVTVPEAGNYKADVSFIKQGKEIAAGNFSYSAIAVDGQGASSSDFAMQDRHWALLAISLLAGLIVGLLIKGRKSSQKQ